MISGWCTKIKARKMSAKKIAQLFHNSGAVGTCEIKRVDPGRKALLSIPIEGNNTKQPGCPVIMFFI